MIIFPKNYLKLKEKEWKRRLKLPSVQKQDRDIRNWNIEVKWSYIIMYILKLKTVRKLES